MLRRAFLTLASFAVISGAAFAQQPPPGFPQYVPPPTDIYTIENQQLMQETLLILREVLSSMREAEGMGPGQRERLEDLSARLDFLITRQQELAMRQRFGR